MIVSAIYLVFIINPYSLRIEIHKRSSG